MIVAILPARGGSKRIKNKNIINIGGKPMIHHTIKILKKTKIFDEIIVTTDSSKIQNISKKAGAKIYFTRPKNLSNDHVGAFEVINHTINFLKNRYDKYPKYVCYVYPSSILLNKKDLISSYKKIKENCWNFVISVTSFGHPPQRGLKINNGKITMIDKKNYKTRTQDLNKIYHDAGQFCWGKTDSWLKKKFIFSKKSFGFKLPRYRAIDLDDMEDLSLLKKIYSSPLNKSRQ